MADSNGNGKVDKGPSALATAHQAWVSAGAKKPDTKALEAIKKELAATVKEYEEIQEKLAENRARHHKASAAAIKLCGGKQPLNLPGLGRVTPSCRGDNLMYVLRTESEAI